MCGSSGDGVIQPWQSAFFSFWKTGSQNQIIPMKNVFFFKKIFEFFFKKKKLPIYDFLFRELDQSGRLFMQSPQNVEHMGWIENEDVFQQYILPWLI